jgi:hypothetical protein
MTLDDLVMKLAPLGLPHQANLAILAIVALLLLVAVAKALRVLYQMAFPEKFDVIDDIRKKLGLPPVKKEKFGMMDDIKMKMKKMIGRA